jgi:hypothetical protein
LFLEAEINAIDEQLTEAQDQWVWPNEELGEIERCSYWA